MYLMNNKERSTIREAMADIPAMSNYTTEGNWGNQWFNTVVDTCKPVSVYLLACLHSMHYNTKPGTDSVTVGALSYVGKLNRNLREANIPLELVETVGSVGPQLEWRKLP